MLHQCQAWEKLQLAFCLILLTTLQFYHPHLLTLPHSVTLLAVHWMPAPVYQLLYACYVVVHSLSRVRLVTTPWTAARQASLPFHLPELKLTSIESAMPSNHPILCHPLLLLPSIFPSVRVFSNESVLHIRWPEYWSFSFSISPSNEYSALISFRMDWLDLLAVQGTLKIKSLLQHHSLKASILQCSADVQLTSVHDYWKNHTFDYMYHCWQSNVSAF